MADPMSIVSGEVGVVSLALHTIGTAKRCNESIRKLKKIPKEVRLLSDHNELVVLLLEACVTLFTTRSDDKVVLGED